MKQTNCDECRKDFAIKLKERKYGVSIKETYFICPHCKKKYTAFVMDNECRRLQRQIGKCQENKARFADDYRNKRISLDEYELSVNTEDAEIAKIQAELEPKMKQLKEQYS